MRPVLSLQMEDETYGERTIHIADHGILLNVFTRYELEKFANVLATGTGMLGIANIFGRVKIVGLKSSGVGIFWSYTWISSLDSNQSFRIWPRRPCTTGLICRNCIPAI